MIHMLSRFDLKSGCDFQKFERDYHRLVDDFKSVGLVESTGQIGRRVSDTEMDTDAEDAPKYYAIMQFKDRDQLDRAYAYIADGPAEKHHLDTHNQVMRAVTNSVFTCWQDKD